MVDNNCVELVVTNSMARFPITNEQKLTGSQSTSFPLFAAL